MHRETKWIGGLEGEGGVEGRRETAEKGETDRARARRGRVFHAAFP